MKEIWVDIKDFEGLYQVSNYGMVKSLGRIDSLGHHRREKMKKPFITRNHFVVKLYKNGVEKTYSIHQLVAQHFIPNPDNKPIVHHIDKNPLNNNVDNLMWCTPPEHAALHKDEYKIVGKKVSKFKIGKKRTEETIKKLIETSTLKKPINQYTKNGDFIKRWNSSRDIERELGYKCSNIIACCRRYKSHISAHGYIWKYADEN